MSEVVLALLGAFQKSACGQNACCQASLPAILPRGICPTLTRVCDVTGGKGREAYASQSYTSKIHEGQHVYLFHICVP